MANRDDFKKVITVKSVKTEYNSIATTDGEFFKVSDNLDLTDFQPGLSYEITGYQYEGKKTKYVAKAKPVENGNAKEAAPAVKPAEAKQPIRIMTPPPAATAPATRPAPTGGRDFTKEAKGKTLSLFVASAMGETINQLIDEELTAEQVINVAEKLVQEMDKRGYF